MASSRSHPTLAQREARLQQVEFDHAQLLGKQEGQEVLLGALRAQLTEAQGKLAGNPPT